MTTVPRITTLAPLLAVGVFGVLAFVCASCAPRLRYERTEGTTEYFATEADRLSTSEFPKLSEPTRNPHEHHQQRRR